MDIHSAVSVSTGQVGAYVPHYERGRPCWWKQRGIDIGEMRSKVVLAQPCMYVYTGSSFFTAAGAKKARMSFFCPASMIFGLTSFVFLGEGAEAEGTPIASSNNANSSYIISRLHVYWVSGLTLAMIPPVASLCPRAKSSPTRSLNPSMESPYSLSRAMRFGRSPSGRERRLEAIRQEKETLFGSA